MGVGIFGIFGLGMGSVTFSLGLDFFWGGL